METVITVLIIAGAAVWLIHWFRNAASGRSGCSCSDGCDRKCSSAPERREASLPEPEGKDG